MLLDGQKISKSLGNTILVTDLIKEGFNPIAFRYLVLTSHYRQGLNFTKKAMEGAQAAYSRLCELVGSWKKEGNRNSLSEEGIEKIDAYSREFLDAVSDDLNFAEGIAVLWQVAKSNLPSRDKLDLVLAFDQVLGLNLSLYEPPRVEVPREVKELAKQREEARAQKQWGKADEIRKEIEALGWETEDTPSGIKIKKK